MATPWDALPRATPDPASKAPAVPCVRGLLHEYNRARQGMIIECPFLYSPTGQSNALTVTRWPWGSLSGSAGRRGVRAAREAAERGFGMGHLWIRCGACHKEGRETLLYEPPHHPAHPPTGLVATKCDHNVTLCAAPPRPMPVRFPHLVAAGPDEEEGT